METTANIVVTATLEAENYIDEIGQRSTYERLLAHLPEHFVGLRSVAVELGFDYDEGGPPTVLIEVKREDPGSYDGVDRDWDRWMIINFSPDEFRHFVVLSFLD